MNAGSASTGVADAAPPTAGSADHPNWSELDLELSCPRCGYNLRMLSVPRCPECGLRFEWDELILAAQQGTNSPLFEYSWRSRPVYSLVRTIGLALCPSRLWRQIPLTSRPRPGALLALVPATALLYVVLAILQLHAWYWPTRAYYWNARGYELRPFWMYWSIEASVLELALPFLFGLAVWLSIQVFRQTIARYRIRQDHILRIVVLSWIPVVVVRGVITLAYSLARGLALWWRGQYLPDVGYLVAAVTALWLLASLGFAFSRYLRVPRAWVWASLVLLLAAVFTFSLIVGVSVYHYDSLANPLVEILEMWGSDS